VRKPYGILRALLRKSLKTFFWPRAQIFHAGSLSPLGIPKRFILLRARQAAKASACWLEVFLAFKEPPNKVFSRNIAVSANDLR